MAGIKPIETTYNGYRFRSRLEARWAYYFDLLGIEYDYEPEGYVLQSGECYLPDFYLTKVNSYFEVKPASFKGREVLNIKRKLEMLADGNNSFAMLCRGDPYDNFIQIYVPSSKAWTSAEVLKGACIWEDDGFSYYEKFKTGFVAGYRYKKEPFECKTINGDESKLIIPFNTVCSFDEIPYTAQKAARQARFEHGESV